MVSQFLIEILFIVWYKAKMHYCLMRADSALHGCIYVPITSLKAIASPGLSQFLLMQADAILMLRKRVIYRPQRQIRRPPPWLKNMALLKSTLHYFIIGHTDLSPPLLTIRIFSLAIIYDILPRRTSAQKPRPWWYVISATTIPWALCMIAHAVLSAEVNRISALLSLSDSRGDFRSMSLFCFSAARNTCLSPFLFPRRRRAWPYASRRRHYFHSSTICLFRLSPAYLSVEYRAIPHAMVIWLNTEDTGVISRFWVSWLMLFAWWHWWVEAGRDTPPLRFT